MIWISISYRRLITSITIKSILDTIHFCFLDKLIHFFITIRIYQECSVSKSDFSQTVLYTSRVIFLVFNKAPYIILASIGSVFLSTGFSQITCNFSGRILGSIFFT